MWKIIALVFCIEMKHTKSNMLHIYEYTGTLYKFVCALLCTHVNIHNHAHIYHQLVFIVSFRDFSLLILQKL